MSLKRGRKGGPLQRGEPGDAHAGEPGALDKIAYQRHCGNCRASCDVHSMHVAAVPLLCCGSSSLVAMASSVFHCGCCGLRTARVVGHHLQSGDMISQAVPRVRRIDDRLTGPGDETSPGSRFRNHMTMVASRENAALGCSWCGACEAWLQQIRRRCDHAMLLWLNSPGITEPKCGGVRVARHVGARYRRRAARLARRVIPSW